MNNKKAKGILAGLLTVLLAVGVVYAAYTVFFERDNTTVTEPLEVTWGETIPADTYSNQEYTSEIKVHNINVSGNGDQKVGVTVTKSSNFDYQNICWSVGSGWTCESGDTWDNYLLTFTVAKNGNVWVKADVKVPSAAAPSGAWVDFKVTRE